MENLLGMYIRVTKDLSPWVSSKATKGNICEEYGQQHLSGTCYLYCVRHPVCKAWRALATPSHCDQVQQIVPSPG